MAPHYNSWTIPQDTQEQEELGAFIQSLDGWEQQLLQGLTLQVSQQEFLQLIPEPTIIATDGSVQDHRGSFGWIIYTLEDRILASGKRPA